jgi:hypothetical protein
LYGVIIPLTGLHDSEIPSSLSSDKGQGAETVKVGDVTVGDGDVTVGLGEETEGKGVATVGETVYTVGLAFLTIPHEPMFPFASVLMRKISASPALKESVKPAKMYPPSDVCRTE